MIKESSEFFKLNLIILFSNQQETVAVELSKYSMGPFISEELHLLRSQK